MMKKQLLILVTVMALLLTASATAAAAVPAAGQNTVVKMAFGLDDPPALKAATTTMNEKAVVHFRDDAVWRNNVESVSINGSETSQYSLTYGKLTLKADNFAKKGTYLVIVTADGYSPATVLVTVNKLLTPPILSAETENNLLGESIVLTFVDNTAWRDAVTSVYVNDEEIASSHYRLIKGQLTLDSGCFPQTGIYEVLVEAEGYQGTAVSQEILTATSYTVWFNSQNGSVVASQLVREGKAAVRPTDPQRSGYTFGGWYRDAACQQLYNFSTPVSYELTLYARWDKVQTALIGHTAINLYLFKTTYTVNGVTYTMDSAPVLYKYGGVNYTMVPLRFVAQALGTAVNWKPGSKTIDLVKDGVTVNLKLNQIDPERGLDCPAVVNKNRTMVPLRYVATSLNCAVNYTDSDEPITIHSL